MSSPQENTFIRRPRGHRTLESTCKRCFLTVATAKRERELDEAEQRHTCDSWLLEQWKQMFEYTPAGKVAGRSKSA
jgi:hypothetical protein